jgi:hypothetical protein
VGLSLAAARRLTKMKLDGARLPREASPAEVAKDGQHNNDDDDDPQDRHVILSLRSSNRLLSRPGRCRKPSQPVDAMSNLPPAYKQPEDSVANSARRVGSRSCSDIRPWHGASFRSAPLGLPGRWALRPAARRGAYFS